MKKIIEIIPNYSEGRDRAVMEAILSPFQREGISLCFLEMDKDYHRSVVTIIGEIDVDRLQRFGQSGSESNF